MGWLIYIVATWSAECLVGFYRLEFYGAGNISRVNLRYLLSLLSGNRIDGRYSLLVAGLRINKVISLLKGTSNNFEVGYISKVLLLRSLEDKE